MLWKLISAFIGSRWRTFCGLSKEDFTLNARKALDDIGYSYEMREVATTQGEETMLGSGGTGSRIVVSDPTPFNIDVITATADPITNFAASFFMPESKIKNQSSDLCVLTITDVNDETRSAIARFVSSIIEKSERPPWELTHHIKFRLAVLLRLKVRVMWSYWNHITLPENESESTDNTLA